MKTLILYIDGLGFNRINKENTPFLHKFGNENSLIRLKTLLAYTGIENTFITGKWPNETGIWVEYIYNKNGIGNFLRIFPLHNKYLSYFYALLNYLKGSTFLSKFYNIPRRFFGVFNNSLKEGLWKNEYFHNKRFLYYSWPFFVINNKIKLDFIKRNDEYKVKKFIKKFDDNIDIYFLHTVDLDKASHEYGVNSENTLKEIKRQDEYASLIVNEFKSRFNDCKIVIWSDHGFLDINGFVNIEEKIKKLKNVDYFLDSTIARFWFKDADTKNRVISELNKIKEGHILNLEEKNRYNIPLNREQGEIIFVVEPGYLILPNFYQGIKGCKGMHGYMPDKADLDGIFLINKKLNRKILNMNEALGLLYNGSIQF